MGSPVYFDPLDAGFGCSIWVFCSAARFTAGCTGTVPPACPIAALLVMATSSAAVLSAKRLAASSAFATGLVASLALPGFTENFGSTKVKSAGFSVFSATAGVGAAFVTLVEIAGAEVTADAATAGFGAS